MAPLERTGQIGKLQQFYLCASFGEVWTRVLKSDSSDGILTPRDLEKGLGKMKLATAKLKNRLSGKKVHGVPEGLRAPKQPILNYRIVFSPVLVPVSFTDRQARYKRVVCLEQSR